MAVPRADGAVAVYPGAPTPVRHAAHRLAAHIGRGAPAVRVALNATADAALGPQGYSIVSHDAAVHVRANTDEGAANGVYTLLRTLMVERRRDPAGRRWDVSEKPHFTVRDMIVAPYRFGGSYGFAVLSPDRWSFDEWREYIDLMRLCNMTTLTLVPGGRHYHPDYPQTHRERWRYEVWREVIAYCHQVGMKCNWCTCPNMVPPEVFWQHPDLRPVQQEAGGYFGCGLDWNKAKDLILEVNRYTFEFLRGLDGLEMIYSEAGFSFDEKTAADPTAYFADATFAYIEMMKQAGCDAEYVFWNWLFDYWATCVLPEDLLQKFPKYRTLQDDILPRLPRNIAWEDASMLSLIQMFGREIRARGNPPLREGVLLGKEQGFRPVIDCFWYMNPEYAINILPHPYIRRAIQEAHYARDELDVEGASGYRLAPPCRFLGDYAFFRLASDPALSQAQIESELAGLLCETPEAGAHAVRGIQKLETFWGGHDVRALGEAEEAFRAAGRGGASQALERVRDGTTFLHALVEMAQPQVDAAQRAELSDALYRAIKEMPVFQGFTTDVAWQSESMRFFRARMEMMVQEYYRYRDHRPDLVDRRIYPEATSERRTLRWPDAPADDAAPRTEGIA